MIGALRLAAAPMLADDSTVVLRRPLRRRHVLRGAALLLAVIASAALLGALIMIRHPASPRFDPGSADETAILAEQPAMLTATRWSPAPAVLVLDFPDLEQQGRMLDRVAALVEKAAAPRYRVLSPAQLADLLARTNDTVATFYYGHDYRAADLARFFSLAARDHIALGTEEQRLHDMAAALGWLQPGAAGALVSIVAIGGAVSPRMRRTILHHELSHGVYFTHPGYVAATRALWRQQMTAEERDRFRAWLGARATTRPTRT